MARYASREPSDIAILADVAHAPGPKPGDRVDFRDFGGCTIVKTYDDGSVELEIPGFGTERVPHGHWKLKEQTSRAKPKLNVLHQSSSERRELEELERMKMRDATDKAMEAILSEHLEEIPESTPYSASSWLARKQFEGRRNHQVWLHIYDLNPLVAKINDYALRAVGMGAFHCGVEVLGHEWFFAWGDSSSESTGVLFTEPKSHQVHVYKESIDMGISPLTIFQKAPYQG